MTSEGVMDDDVFASLDEIFIGADELDAVLDGPSAGLAELLDRLSPPTLESGGIITPANVPSATAAAAAAGDRTDTNAPVLVVASGGGTPPAATPAAADAVGAAVSGGIGAATEEEDSAALNISAETVPLNSPAIEWRGISRIGETPWFPPPHHHHSDGEDAEDERGEEEDFDHHARWPGGGRVQALQQRPPRFGRSSSVNWLWNGTASSTGGVYETPETTPRDASDGRESPASFLVHGARSALQRAKDEGRRVSTFLKPYAVAGAARARVVAAAGAARARAAAADAAAAAAKWSRTHKYLPARLTPKARARIASFALALITLILVLGVIAASGTSPPSEIGELTSSTSSLHSGGPAGAVATSSSFYDVIEAAGGDDDAAMAALSAQGGDHPRGFNAEGGAAGSTAPNAIETTANANPYVAKELLKLKLRERLRKKVVERWEADTAQARHDVIQRKAALRGGGRDDVRDSGDSPAGETTTMLPKKKTTTTMAAKKTTAVKKKAKAKEAKTEKAKATSTAETKTTSAQRVESETVEKVAKGGSASESGFSDDVGWGDVAESLSVRLKCEDVAHSSTRRSQMQSPLLCSQDDEKWVLKALFPEHASPQPQKKVKPAPAPQRRAPARETRRVTPPLAPAPSRLQAARSESKSEDATAEAENTLAKMDRLLKRSSSITQAQRMQQRMRQMNDMMSSMSG